MGSVICIHISFESSLKPSSNPVNGIYASQLLHSL